MADKKASALQKYVSDELASFTSVKRSPNFEKEFLGMVLDHTYAPFIKIGASGKVKLEAALWVRQDTNGIELKDMLGKRMDWVVPGLDPSGLVIAPPKETQLGDGLWDANTDMTYITPKNLETSVKEFAEAHNLGGSEEQLIASAKHIGRYLVANSKGSSLSISLLDTREGVNAYQEDKLHESSNKAKSIAGLTKGKITEIIAVGSIAGFIPGYIGELIGHSASLQGGNWGLANIAGPLAAAIIAYRALSNPRKTGHTKRKDLGKEEEVYEPVFLGGTGNSTEENKERYAIFGEELSTLVPKEMIVTGRRKSYQLKHSGFNLPLWLVNNPDKPLFWHSLTDTNSTAMGGEDPAFLIGVVEVSVTIGHTKIYRPYAFSINHNIKPLPSPYKGQHSDGDSADLIKPLRGEISLVDTEQNHAGLRKVLDHLHRI